MIPREDADHAQGVLVQCRLGRARTRLPLSADRHSGDLFFQCLAACHRVGRLVDAMVLRAHRRPRHARIRLGDAAHRSVVGDGGDRARHACGHRIGSVRTLPRPAAIFRHGLCAAGDARGHHRACLVAPVRGGRCRSRLLDHHDRSHDADHVLRHGGRAIAAADFRHES